MLTSVKVSNESIFSMSATVVQSFMAVCKRGGTDKQVEVKHNAFTGLYHHRSIKNCPSYIKEFKDKRANPVDPDEVAHYKLPHLDLQCSQIQLM